jgi:hypothetical protein
MESPRNQRYLATPHGLRPTLIVATTRFVVVSKTETSFDNPFAV